MGASSTVASSTLTVTAASSALRDAEADLSATEAGIVKLRESIALATSRLDLHTNAIVLNDSQNSALQTQQRAIQMQLTRFGDGLAARDQRLELSRDCLLQTSQKMEVLRLRQVHASELLRAKSREVGMMAARLAERRQQLRSLNSQILMTRLRLQQGRYPPSQRRASAFSAWRDRIANMKALLELYRRAMLRWRAARMMSGLVRWRVNCSRAARRDNVVRQQKASRLLQSEVQDRRLQVQIETDAAGPMAASHATALEQFGSLRYGR